MRISIISLFFFLSAALTAQTLEETFALANQLHAASRFQEARKMYQRIVFFDADSEYPEAIQSLGDLHMMDGNPDEALIAYKKAVLLSRDNLQAIQGKCRALISLGRSQEALLEIYQIDTLANASAPQVYHFLLGTAQFSLQNMDEAQKHFRHLLKGQPEQLEKLDALATEWHKIDDLNPKGRKLLSYLLPGLGQASIGEFGEAANSILVNAGFYYLFISMIRATAWLDAVLLAYPWFSRYYHGGAARAYRLTKAKKARGKSAVYNEILHLLE